MYPNLDREMKQKNISGMRLAQMLGVQRYQTFMDKIKGRSTLDLATAKAIRDAVSPNTSIDILFATEEKKCTTQETM